MTIKSHFITIFYLMRSYKIVFTAPLIRIAIQYIIYKEARLVLPIEVVILLLTIFAAIARWISIKIIITNTMITIKRGLFIKSCVNIEKSRLLSITTNQNMLHIAFGCSKCRFNTSTKSDKHLEIMLSRKDVKLLRDIIYGDLNIKTINRQNKLKRFFAIPAVVFVVIVIIAGLQLNFSGFKENILFIIVGLFFINLFYAGLCYYDYKQGKLCFEDIIFAKSVDAFNIQSFCCHESDVGIVKITRNPFDYRHNTCKIKIITRGECGKSIKVKYVKTKDAIKKINQLFKTNIDV